MKDFFKMLGLAFAGWLTCSLYLLFLAVVLALGVGGLAGVMAGEPLGAVMLAVAIFVGWMLNRAYNSNKA